MRFSSLFLSFFVCLVACGGATNEPSEVPGGASAANTPNEPPATTPGSNDSQPATAPANDCPSPASVIAKSGTTLRQPVGSAQRFQLVYQGSALGVTALRGVDMIIGGSDGTFTADKNSGPARSAGRQRRLHQLVDRQVHRQDDPRRRSAITVGQRARGHRKPVRPADRRARSFHTRVKRAKRVKRASDLP